MFEWEQVYHVWVCSGQKVVVGGRRRIKNEWIRGMKEEVKKNGSNQRGNKHYWFITCSMTCCMNDSHLKRNSLRSEELGKNRNERSNCSLAKEGCWIFFPPSLFIKALLNGSFSLHHITHFLFILCIWYLLLRNKWIWNFLRKYSKGYECC